MKWFFLLTLFLHSLFVSAAAPKSVIIEVETHPRNPVHRQVERFTLREEKNLFFCSTDSVPEHKIQVKGLSLASPFIEHAINRRCETIVRWGKSATCYKKFEIPLLDETIRWCSRG